MMMNVRRLSGAALLVLLAAVGAWAGETKVTTLTTDSNQFGIKLYDTLADQPGNVFISPLSLHAALAMMLPGARGQTAEQITTALELQAPDLLQAYSALLQGTPDMPGINAAAGGKDRGFQLTTVNTLWTQEGHEFEKQYLDTVKSTFDAAPRPLNFGADPDAARAIINQWVQKETHDKIKDLLAPGTVTKLTRLVLTNAVYFKADWQSPFAKNATRPAPFTRADGQMVQVPTMHQTEHVAYFETDALQGITLPYRGGEVTMTILLPKKADGLAAVTKTLSAATLDQWLKGAQQRNVAVALPRFKFVASYDMIPSLEKLGMTAAFNSKEADFSGLDGRRDLFISAVVHKAFVAVDEEGTEAAAATAVGFTASAMPAPVVLFRADHPFLFVIRHQPTGAILFLGRLDDPR